MAAQRTCAAADRTGHAILHTLYGVSLKHKTEFLLVFCIRFNNEKWRV